MSVGVMSWVWQHSSTSGNDRLALLCLADEADDDGGNCYPSMERIAAKCNVDKGTAIDAIKRLEALEEILVLRPERRGRGHHNRYVLVLGRNPGALRQALGWTPPNGGGPPPLDPVDNPDEIGGESPPIEPVNGGDEAVNGGATPPEMVAPAPPDPKTYPYRPPERAARRPKTPAGADPLEAAALAARRLMAHNANRLESERLAQAEARHLDAAELAATIAKARAALQRPSLPQEVPA